EPRKFHKETIKRAILRSYAAALVAGNASRRYLIKLGFNPHAIFQPWDVVDNGFFSRIRDHAPVPYHEKPFLCVSRFIAKKNLPRLIEAFGLYAKKGGSRNLILLGSGELEGVILDQINDLGLSERVKIEG